MGEYSIVSEFRYFKIFPFLAAFYQFVAIGLAIFGYYITSIGIFLAFIFEGCSFYYIFLSFCKKYYRVNISSGVTTVWSVFNKPTQYCTIQLRWRIKRIPWYNAYFIFLYSSTRIPIAIFKPHWKNALRVLSFPHLGVLTDMELKYIKFLKKVGLIK